jgi:hypothetical protein
LNSNNVSSWHIQVQVHWDIVLFNPQHNVIHPRVCEIVQSNLNIHTNCTIWNSWTRKRLRSNSALLFEHDFTKQQTNFDWKRNIVTFDELIWDENEEKLKTVEVEGKRLQENVDSADISLFSLCCLCAFSTEYANTYLKLWHWRLQKC